MFAQCIPFPPPGAATKKQIDLATKLCRDLHFGSDLPPGGKYDPLDLRPGGFGVTAIPWLRELGFDQNILGRYTEDDVPARDALASKDVRWRMHKVAGPGALHAVQEKDGEPTVLRVLRGPGPKDWTPTKEEGDYLSRSPAAIAVLGGSTNSGYEEFVLAAAAARGKPVYWNASGKADLGLAGTGEVYLQISCAEVGDGKERPEALAAKLLTSSGAAGCIVTQSGGSYGVFRGSSEVLFASAIRLPSDLVRRRIGAGDAYAAGAVAALLSIPKGTEHRTERIMHMGRLVASYHVTGLPACGWYALGLFGKKYHRPEIDRISKAA